MGKQNNWRKPRSINRLVEKEYHYIFSEGKCTEPNYFRGFKRCIDQNAKYCNAVEIITEGLGTNTIQVVEGALNHVTKHDIQSGHIWCVFDLDSFPADDFENAVSKINALDNRTNKLRYHAIWSNQCFELWFVLHFVIIRPKITGNPILTN